MMDLKRLNITWILILAAGLAATAASATETTLTARQIMMLEDERPDGDDRRSSIKMILINKRGRQRVREVVSFSRDYGKDKKMIMYFEKPTDVKGTAFLSWEYDAPDREDDKWLYLPAMKKVRRVSGKSKDEYFMGTDFTYDDMGDRNVDEDTHTLLGEETVMGHDCWKVESIPVDPDDMYTRKVVWVRKDAYIVVMVEYYDKDGLIKIYRALDIRKQDGFWTAFKTEMDNVSQRHKTIMETRTMAYNPGLKESLFKVSTLQRGRIR